MKNLIKKILRESDEWDWIRDEVINPWVEYDGINFDAKPTKEEVNTYIELALNSRRVDNRKAWLSGRTRDINLIINLIQTKKRAFLVLGPDNILSYVSDMKYFPSTGNKKPKVIKYSQLKEPKTNINEDAEWDWIREIPSNPLQWHKPKINLDNVERDEEGYPLQQGFGEGEIWVDVDGLTQDQKINVLKNIESIIGELRFENTLTTIKSIEGNKNRDHCLGNNIKGYVLHCGHEEYDFFSQENHVCCMNMGYQTFREEVQIEVPRINGRDLIRIV